MKNSERQIYCQNLNQEFKIESKLTSLKLALVEKNPKLDVLKLEIVNTCRPQLTIISNDIRIVMSAAYTSRDIISISYNVIRKIKPSEQKFLALAKNINAIVKKPNSKRKYMWVEGEKNSFKISDVESIYKQLTLAIEQAENVTLM